MSRPPPRDPVPKNNEPTGTVQISGNTVVGQTLTVTNNITDKDGIASKITYQWCRTKKGTKTNITKATKETYLLTAEDVSYTISVIASYTDKSDKAESVTSAATAEIEEKPQVEKKKLKIRFHSRRKPPTRGDRVRSGRRNVFFRQPTIWRINHPAGRSNTIE